MKFELIENIIHVLGKIRNLWVN